VSDATYAWFRYGVLAVAALFTLGGFAAMAVQRRVINPFSRTARLIRTLTDPLLKPVERRLHRIGGNPAQGPWWLVGLGVAGGIALISLADWARGEIGVILAASELGARGIEYLAASTLFTVLEVAIFVRVIGSWLGAGPHTPWMRPFVWLTEWLIAPLRRIIPTMGMFDFTPMAAWILLWLLRPVALGLVAPSLTVMAR